MKRKCAQLDASPLTCRSIRKPQKRSKYWSYFARTTCSFDATLTNARRVSRFPDYDPAPRRATPIAPASRDVRIIANSDSRPQHYIQLTHKFVSRKARSVVAAEPHRQPVRRHEFAGPRGTMHKSGDLCAQIGGFVGTSRGICAHKVGDLCVVPPYRHRLYP